MLFANKHQFFLILLCLISIECFSQKILFLGFHDVRDSKKNYWCLDRSYEHAEVKTKAEYDTLKKHFNNKNKGLSPFTLLINQDESCIVYEFETEMKGFNCTKKTAFYLKGKSEIDVMLKFDNLNSKSKTKYSIVFKRRGEKQIETITENYNNVIVKYLFGLTSNGKLTVIVQARNTNKSSAAVLVVKSIGEESPSETIILNPGEAMTRNIETTEGIDIQLKEVDPNELKRKSTDSFVKTIKDFIGNSILIKNGKLEKTPIRKQLPCMCIRG